MVGAPLVVSDPPARNLSLVNVAPILRGAVIGCGRVGSILEQDRLRSHPCTHAGFLEHHPRTRLVAGCDTRADRRARFSVDWGLPAAAVYEDYREMLRDVRPEFVSIATYTDSHAAIAIAAARAGARIILCEKPMAMTTDQATAMIETCRREGALLAVHHERRWSRQHRLARRIIDEGAIGELRTIVGHVLTGEPPRDWHAHLAVSGGGPALHDGTHLFDAVRYLGGEIVAARGETRRADPSLPVEDTLYAVLSLSSGALAFLECGGRRRYFDVELDIQGSKGRILIGNAVFRLFQTGPSSRYENFVEFLERPLPADDAPDYFPWIVDELLDAAESGRPSVSSGEDGRAALKVILDLYAFASSLV